MQTIERIQAMLMLGLYEWGMCIGAKAWLTIGVAIRTAQAMGFQYEIDLDDEPLSRSLTLDQEAAKMGVNGAKLPQSGIRTDGDAFMQQEIRRRTFWSCYIMDRYLSSGKYRPQMLHAKEMRIQLPASERSFLFAEKVRTLMLCEEEDGVAGRAEVQNLRRASVMLSGMDPPSSHLEDSSTAASSHADVDDKGRLEVGGEEGLISRYIKMLEIYGRVMKWSCAGGRRTEKHPPWSPQSEVYHLRQQCLAFKASIPRQHTLTPQNTEAHVIRKSSTSYMLIHTVYLLCQLMLHREYVPFIPMRCSKPEGPLDPPLFPPEQYSVPPGYWNESARELFKAARDIIDLVRSCQEWDVLVETPIVGFAIYEVCFTGVYCLNFPWMDPGSSLSSSTPIADGGNTAGGQTQDRSGYEAVRKAMEILGQMRPKLTMADGWFRTVHRMYEYYRHIKRDYKKNVAALESSADSSDASPTSTRHLSLREGGVGGGLDEFKLLERTLHDFGNLEDHDVEMVEAEHRPLSRHLETLRDDSQSRSGATVKSEDANVAAASPSQRPDAGSWNAVNAASGSSSGLTENTPAPSSGTFRPWEDYDPQHQLPESSRTSPEGAAQLPLFRPPSYNPQFSNTTRQVQDLTASTVQSAISPSHSQLSPRDGQPQPFARQDPQPTSYAPRQQPGERFDNSYAYASYSQQQRIGPVPFQAAQVYPTLEPPRQHGHLPPSHPEGMHTMHQPWNEEEKEAWFAHLHTDMGGDDFAAFADGGDMADYGRYGAMAAGRGYAAGWLGTLWEQSPIQ